MGRRRFLMLAAIWSALPLVGPRPARASQDARIVDGWVLPAADLDSAEQQ